MGDRFAVAGLTLGGTVASGVSTVPAAAAYACSPPSSMSARRVGRFGASLVFPVLIAVFVALFTWSAALTFGRRRVRWRGRVLEVRRAR